MDKTQTLLLVASVLMLDLLLEFSKGLQSLNYTGVHYKAPSSMRWALYLILILGDPSESFSLPLVSGLANGPRGWLLKIPKGLPLRK